MRLSLDDMSGGEGIESSGLESQKLAIRVLQVYKEQQSQLNREAGQSTPVLR